MFKVSSLTCEINSKKILRNISFDFKQSEWISIIGPNGSGKTTLLKCLAFLLEHSGEISFMGKVLPEVDKKMFFKNVGILFQNFENNSSVKVRDFIFYSFYPFEKSISRSDMNSAFTSIVSKLKIDDIVNQNLDSLSGGELQKVKLAACLIKNPKVLLLDEIFNHLDPKIQDEIEDILISFNNDGGSIFLISHDLNRAFYNSSHLLCLKNGEVFYDGSPQLLVDSGKLNLLFDKKFKILKDGNSDKKRCYIL